MIVYAKNDLKLYETCSTKLNEDWTGKADFVIDETNPKNAELIQKIKDYAPYFNYITNIKGDLIDVEKTGELIVGKFVDPTIALLDENRTLKAQVQALTESNQFLEDCLVEMAEIVYA